MGGNKEPPHHVSARCGKREMYPSLTVILSNFPESCLHHADAQHTGCEGHGELAPALSAADSNTNATAVGSLPGGHFWHLSLVALPPVSPKPLLSLDFQLPFSYVPSSGTRETFFILAWQCWWEVWRLSGTSLLSLTNWHRVQGADTVCHFQSTGNVGVGLNLSGLLGSIPSAYLGEGRGQEPLRHRGCSSEWHVGHGESLAQTGGPTPQRFASGDLGKAFA